MTRRLRVSHVVIQPVLIWDDGEDLAPGPAAQPQQVPLAALSQVPDDIRAQVVGLEAQLLAEAAED